MSGIHINSEDSFNQQIEKLEPNKTYDIKDRKIIKTIYGERTILIDNNKVSYWAPGNLIKSLTPYPELKSFLLKTGNTKIWIDKNKVNHEILTFDIYA